MILGYHKGSTILIQMSTKRSTTVVLLVPLLVLFGSCVAKAPLSRIDPAGTVDELETDEYGKYIACTAEHVDIDWHIQFTKPDVLSIQYTAKNRTKQRVFLLDKILAQDASDSYYIANDRMIVQHGDKEGDIDFMRGFVTPRNYKTNDQSHLFPGFHILEAGQSINGSAVCKIPLSSWYPFGYSEPIRTSPNYVRLRLGYYLMMNNFRQVRLADGTAEPIPVPEAEQMQLWACSKRVPWASVTNLIRLR